MKFLHTADWHLGKALFGRSLLEDQRWFLEDWFLPLVDREHPDAVVLAGDIFDRQIPPVEAVGLFDGFLRALCAREVPLIAVTGNHDGAERLSMGASLLRASGVVLATRPADLYAPYTLEAGAEKVCFHTLPYCEPAAARALLGDEDIRTADGAVRALLQKARPLPGACNVLVAHCFAAGGAVGASENPAFVGPASQVGLDSFAPFDYVALGHLHGAQKAGPGRYAGSPLKYSFDEAGQKKGVVRVTVEGGAVRAQVIPLTPPRDVRRVRGEFDGLLAQAKAAPSEDYLFAALTDPKPVYQPVDRLRPYWPNLLSVASECLLAQGAGENDALRREMRRRRVDDGTIFAEFLRQVCGTEATAEDLALFSQAGKEEDA